MAIRDSGGLDGVVFMVTVVNELTQRDHEARRKKGALLGEESWDALVSIDGQRGAIQGSQDAEKKGGNSEESRCLGMGDRATCYREVK